MLPVLVALVIRKVMVREWLNEKRLTSTFAGRASIPLLGWVTGPGRAISFKEILKGQSVSLGLLPSLLPPPPLLAVGSRAMLYFLGCQSAGTFRDRLT